MLASLFFPDAFAMSILRKYPRTMNLNHGCVSLSLMLHLMYVQRLQYAAIVNGGTHVRRQNAVSFVCSSVVVSEGKGAKQQFVLGG